MKHDDIEILDFDEEIDYTNKNIIVEKKKVSNIVESEPIKKKVNSSLNMKKSNKYCLGEKIFITISILFIIGCFVFYGYRTYYYYHKTHDVVKNISLKEKLTSLNNITYQNDGLYEKEGYFYYKGADVNNYVYYSGRLFRIIDISNDGIRLIEDDTETNLIWGIDTNYKDSYI